MLYLIESGIYAKIGYSTDYKTLENRIQSYQTHNPSFNVIDLVEGSLEDEKKLQALYKEYKANPKTEWSYAKKLVVKIWMDYRASRENVDYYTEFGIGVTTTEKFGKIENKTNLIKAIQNSLVTDKDTDMFSEFEQYYNDIEDR